MEEGRRILLVDDACDLRDGVVGEFGVELVEAEGLAVFVDLCLPALCYRRQHARAIDDGDLVEQSLCQLLGFVRGSSRRTLGDVDRVQDG
jgi:hypothetical protein